MAKQSSPASVTTQVIRLLRTANVTINDQWEGSTGCISEAEATRLANAIASLQPTPDAAAIPRTPDKFDKIADARNFYDPREAEDYAAKLRSNAAATSSTPEGLADFARRCRAYLDDCPGDGGHSDAAGSTAYELIEEAIEHCTLPPSIAAAQPTKHQPKEDERG